MASKKNGPTDIGAGIAGIRADLKKQATALTEVAAAIRAEIAQVNDRLDRLEQRQTNDSVRTATELTAVAGSMTTLIEAVKALGADMREVKAIVTAIRQDDRISELKAELAAQATRLAALEQKAS